MSENLDELFYLEKSILINLIQESTKNCAFLWSRIDRTTFQVDILIESVPWTVRVGRITGVYYLEFFKEGRLFVDLKSFNNEGIQSIYETIEEQLSFEPDDEKELLDSLRDNICCVNLKTYHEHPSGGVVTGGKATVLSSTDDFIPTGGVVVGGVASLAGSTDIAITFSSSIDLTSDVFTDDWWIEVDGTQYREGESIVRTAGTDETYEFFLNCNVGANPSFLGWRLINLDGTTNLGATNPIVLETPDQDSTLKGIANCSLV